MKRLIIIGAGGHGRVCAEIARLTGYDDVAFLDDRNMIGLPIIGTPNEFEKYISDDFFVAIGNNEIRHRIVEKIRTFNGSLASLIHPRSTVSPGAIIGCGSVVMAGAVVNTGATIGNGVIINTCSSVDHDCIINDFVHVAVGAHLAGTVTVGVNTFIGAGATVINNISICGKCIIGAGAVVVKNITVPGTYIGIPAEERVHGTNINVHNK